MHVFTKVISNEIRVTTTKTWLCPSQHILELINYQQKSWWRIVQFFKTCLLAQNVNDTLRSSANVRQLKCSSDHVLKGQLSVTSMIKSNYVRLAVIKQAPLLIRAFSPLQSLVVMFECILFFQWPPLSLFISVKQKYITAY